MHRRHLLLALSSLGLTQNTVNSTGISVPPFGCALNRASGDSYFSCLPPEARSGALYWLMLQTNVLPFLTGAVHNGPRLVFALGTLIMALGPAAC